MENKQRKIYVVGSSNNYANWMQGSTITRVMEGADLVVFTGGEDVTPVLYGEKANPQTSYNFKRDSEELEEFKKAQELKIPCIGICRGSQFLCVAAGGKLVQHQQNPSYIHDIDVLDGKTIKITSTHHQAQYPYNLAKNNYKLLGWTKGISKMHENGEQKELELPEGKEAEIVYYPKIKALGIQGHPESMFSNYNTSPDSTATINYLRGLLDNLLENKL